MTNYTAVFKQGCSTNCESKDFYIKALKRIFGDVTELVPKRDAKLLPGNVMVVQELTRELAITAQRQSSARAPGFYRNIIIT